MGTAAFLNSTVEIQQSRSSQAGSGGTRQVFSTRIASLPCKLQKKNLREVDLLRGKTTVVSRWMLYCAADTDGLSIENTDRAIWGTRTLQIKTIYNPDEGTDHLEIECLEIT